MPTENPKIDCLPNGPYLLKNDDASAVTLCVQTAEGEDTSKVSGVALCRCGGSKNKPFCDGAHRSNDFSDAKVADGSQDRRVSYQGKQITIHDNRGICAHAGFCTEQLSSVFRMKREPWIDPDGASVDEIIELVQKCPSGAISYSINDVEHQDPQDMPIITVVKDGPYAVSGIDLKNQALGDGVSAGRYTLCRCGASKNKPFCDGSHWEAGFKDDAD